jgi:type II secretory pathway pseudopilin PulG
MRRRGHTLYELMISLSLIAALSGFTALLVQGARAIDRAAQSSENDLRHVRRAADLVAASVRSAAHVEWEDGALITDGVRWSVRDDALVRDDETVVRGVARLEVVETAPRVWSVGVAPIVSEPHRRAPVLATAARQRVERAR